MGRLEGTYKLWHMSRGALSFVRQVWSAKKTQKAHLCHFTPLVPLKSGHSEILILTVISIRAHFIMVIWYLKAFHIDM